MDFVFNITTLGFVMGVKNIIRTSRKNAAEKPQNFLTGHLAEGFHYRTFHGTKKTKPVEDRKLMYPSLD